MELLIVVLAILLSFLLAAAFVLGRYFTHRHYMREEISPVSRQHLDLFQGGHLSETAVEATKAQFRELLERGRSAEVERRLRPGVQYVVQVRALAELGTEAAGRILERQLQRTISDDQLEQSWYWIDVASGLRVLNRAQSLPALLRCSERACEIPLGHLFAAETVCVLGFSGYLIESDDLGLRRSALRVLHRTLEGLRWGLPPHVVTESRLGEMLETLIDTCDDPGEPIVVRIFHETLRFLRRAGHAERLLQGDPPELEAFQWQLSRMGMLEHQMQELLQRAPAHLRRQLPKADIESQRDMLKALIDLRSEAGETVLTLLESEQFSHRELAIEVLTWSRAPRVGTWIRHQILSQVPMLKRAQRKRRAITAHHRPLPSTLAYGSLLFALRGHPSPQTEGILFHAARDCDPTYRIAAISSLGWWEPMQREEVLLALQETRRDMNPEVRQAARAALARLGERQALQWFRQTLASEDAQRAHETIQAIASEGLTLLWPELDRLADAEDPEIAHHARETLTRLGEALEHGHLFS